jgi:hypothetical protein
MGLVGRGCKRFFVRRVRIRFRDGLRDATGDVLRPFQIGPDHLDRLTIDGPNSSEGFTVRRVGEEETDTWKM